MSKTTGLWTVAGLSVRSVALATIPCLLLVACGAGVRESAGTGSPGAGQGTHQAALGKPNIIFILNDDLGWGDVGYHGSAIKTPTLDGLAKRGVELNRYYTYAVCSPTRAALMSGRSSLETGVDAPIGLDKVLPMEATLLPQHLKSLGYQTMMIGKWHLGQSRVEHLPFKRGFDYYYGFLGGFIDHYTHLSPQGQLDWQRNGVSVREEGYSTDLLTADAIKQIKSRDKGKPLFLYLAYDAPHTPLQAPAEAVNRYASISDPVRRTYAAMVDYQDAQLARVFATIEAEGMSQNTLIIWASDNGPQGNSGGTSGGLRGNKGTAFEGGQRVPAIAYWPGHLDGGKQLQSVVTVLDWFPTLIEAAGGTVPNDKRIVGHNVLPVLRGTAQASGTAMVIGNRSQRVPGYYESAYRWPWKLLRMPTALLDAPGQRRTEAPADAPGAKTVMMFDVMADPNESNDVAALHPDLVAKLLADLDAAPRAPFSLSEWGSANPRNAGGGGAGGRAAPPPGGRPGGPGANGPDRSPEGANPLDGFTVERGEPLAEAAARESAQATGSGR